jgi:superfamily I DNA and/or RNA helicase
MRPEISIFPSAAFYEGRISNGANVTSAKYETGIYRNLVKKQPYCFVQVDGVEERQQSGSFHNVKEAEQVAAILLETRHRSRCTGLAQNNQWCSSSRIRVITFYQAQVDLISATLKANGLADVSVSTVDSCQGSEADLVVISFVRTGQTNTIGFLSDNRRLNVALTRAKHKLVCVGRAENGLSQVISRGAETMRALIENVVDRKILAKEYDPKVKVIRPNCWIPHHRGGGTTTNRPHPHQRHKKPPVSKKRSQDKSRGPAKRPKH